MVRYVRLLFLITVMALLLACNTEQPAAPVGVPTSQTDGATAQSASANPPAAQPVAETSTPTLIPPPTPTPEAPIGRLVIWHSWAQAEGDALTQILTQAQAAYPELQVETLYVGVDDISQAYAEAVLAGGGPDLLLAPDWWLNDLQEAGVLAPLEDLVPASVLDRFWPATLQGLLKGDHLYGLPTSFELVSLYYNRSLIDESQLPQTTEDLIHLAEEDPSQGIGLYASLFHLYWGIPAYGGLLFDDDYRSVLDQTEGAGAFLIWLRRASQVLGIYVDQDYGMLLDRFKKGEYAFFVDGPWAAPELGQALGANLGVTQLPAGPVGPAQPWIGVDGVFVNPNLNADQKWLAATLAQFLTNAESATVLAQIANRLPAVRAAELGEDPIRQGFAAQAASAQPLPVIPEMEAVWGYGGDMILKVVYGNADPTLTVLETATLINEANGK